MDIIHLHEWHVLKSYPNIWNKYEKTIPMEERDLAVWQIEQVAILPKFFIKNNLEELATIQAGFDIIQRQVKEEHVCASKIKYDVKFDPRPEQEIVFKTFLDIYNKNGSVNGILQARPGVGKGNPYSEPILTPHGWTTMGELKVDDDIISKQGISTKVQQIHELGEEDLYEITFADNSTSICTYEHLWKVNLIGSSKTDIIQTKDMLNFRKKDEFTKYNTYQKKYRYSVDLCEPINFKQKDELLIDPYVLGLLIGDGSLTLNSVISFSDQTGDNIEKLKNILYYKYDDINIYKTKGSNNSTSVDYNIKSKKLINDLKSLKLHGKKSICKFIPDEYLLSTVNNRKLLLQGLLDTDSYKLNNKNSVKQYSYEYYTSSKKLINNFQELTRSLGIYTNDIRINEEPKYTYKGEIKIGSPAYSIVINFKKKRKTITNIVKLNYKEKSRCITVDNKDHLYITRDYTVTHNTFMSIKLSSIIGLKTICIVPNSILEDQWVDEIMNFTGLPKEDIGIIQGSDIDKIKKDKILEKDIIVVKIQTLLSQLKRIGHTELEKFYSTVGLVFYDECHQSGAAESYGKTSTIFKTNNIIGLSATPFVKGVNEFLMYNSIGKVLVDLDHQNLLPTITVHNVYVPFTEKEIQRLNFSKTDYIRFLATHNMILEEKDEYLNHLADWAIYRHSTNHITAILFATNKMVYKMEKILRNRGYDVGIITGSTKKKIEESIQYITKAQLAAFNNEYYDFFPKRKSCPAPKVFKDDKDKFKLTKPILKDIEKMIVKFPSLKPHWTIVNNMTDREIMGSKDIVVSNFKMLTTGYSRSELTNIIIGTPLVGAIPSIQVTGRITRKCDTKNQDIQAQFFFTNQYFKMFPDMHFTLVNNLKKSYKEAKFKYEGFEFGKKRA